MSADFICFMMMTFTFQRWMEKHFIWRLNIQQIVNLLVLIEKESRHIYFLWGHPHPTEKSTPHFLLKLTFQSLLTVVRSAIPSPWLPHLWIINLTLINHSRRRNLYVLRTIILNLIQSKPKVFRNGLYWNFDKRYGLMK